jgi:hypothetical protein
VSSGLETYRQTLLDLYLRLPETPRRLSRFDLRLVRQLWERQIPLTTMDCPGRRAVSIALSGASRCTGSRLFIVPLVATPFAYKLVSAFYRELRRA